MKAREMKKVFSKRLKIAMDERGMDVSKLSNLMLCSWGTIQGYLNGVALPNVATLRHISELLNFSTDYLLGLEEE